MRYIYLLEFFIFLLLALSCKKETDYIPFPPETITVKVTKDTTINCYDYQSFILDASTGDTSSTYFWEAPLNSNSAIVSVSDPLSTPICVIDINTDTFFSHYTVYFNYMNTTMYYPNSFSPNNDGINDYWSPHGGNIDTEGYSLKIYDENDHLLYKTDNYYNGWDGKLNEVTCPAGYYYYVVKYTTLNGEKHKDSGMIQLIK